MKDEKFRPVKIITVSTSDIPAELADSHDIKVIPEYVRFGERLYRDRVEMSVEAFLKEVKTNPEFPKTTPPTPADYQEAFQAALDGGYDVLYIGLSNYISSGLKMARIAKESLGSERIALVDSGSLSMGLGMIALDLAESARAGLPLPGLVAKGEELRQRSYALFMVDNLEFLRKGGRLSGTQAFVGGLLQVKPLLQVAEGKISVKEKIRGQRERGMQRIVDLLLEGHNPRSRWAVAHIGCSRDAEALARRISAETDKVPVIASCGVVVGTHCGPGGLALFRLDR